MDVMGPDQEGRLAGGRTATLQEWPCSQLLGYYFMASFSLKPASSAVITSWKVYFPQRQMGSIRKLTELEAGPMLVPRPAHGGFVIQLNSYLS